MGACLNVLMGLLTLVTIVGCGPGASPITPGGSPITVGADGLRTFAVTTSYKGGPILCTAGGAIPPLVGTLTGRAGAREPVWLSLADGRTVSVVWPHGFTARFEPGATLYNDRGERVATDGDRVELGQVSRDSHAGTYDDPFIASGIMFDGCYLFAG